MSAGDSETIWDSEAHKLFARLNLQDGEGVRPGEYDPLNAIWRHPETRNAVFVGNIKAARMKDLHQQHGIMRVVNCTQKDRHGSIRNFYSGSYRISVCTPS